MREGSPYSIRDRDNLIRKDLTDKVEAFAASAAFGNAKHAASEAESIEP